jgi:hypothetical protein
MTQTEALKLALEALELVSIEFVCNGAHHEKKDRHDWADPCPIVDRYKDAITAIKAALANEALERKAENARELGLDYEPAAPVQEPVAWKDENAKPAWPDDLVDDPCPSCGKQLQTVKGGGTKCSCGYWFCF